MDLLDFIGPIEVLSHVRDNNRVRLSEVLVAADTEKSSTSQNVPITRDISTDEALEQLASFDILLVPGGGGFSEKTIPDQPGVKSVIKAFSQLPASTERHTPRYIVSICAGVFFLAEQGLLKGKTVTVHYASLAELQKVCDANGGSKVVRQHYVDCGVLEQNGTRIITSGGIASGLDAAFYLAEKVWGFEYAEKARATMDAVWRREALPAGY